MEDSILKFNEQFDYEPEVVGGGGLRSFDQYKNFVLAGMGGSHLAGGILHAHSPGINLYIHRDYGLPPYDEEFSKDYLYIASSYSGNTEEIVDFLDEAYSKGHDVLVIATGGKLIDFAKENSVPYIQIPDTGIQPRLAIGFSTIALASVVAPNLIPELREMKNLNPESLKSEGESIAESLNGKIPVIYTSTVNRAIGYNWKIKMNETGKVPAYYNVFPELNHNEMQGYSDDISDRFHFIIIQDGGDSERVVRRMDVVEELFEEKGLPVTRLHLNGESRFAQIFNSLLLADWTALGLANVRGVEPEQVPLIEEFKERIG